MITIKIKLNSLLTKIYMNRRQFIQLSAASCCGIFLPSCATNPITDRKQLLIYPEAFINRQSAIFTKILLEEVKLVMIKVQK